MRARYIYEELRFERTGDVKKGLSIGKRKKIHDWFSEWAPDVEYEIGDDLSVYVKGFLWLEDSQVTYLPNDDLSVTGGLMISGSQIKRLPENLSVAGPLDLVDSLVTRLPEDLSVGRDLYLQGSQVTQLPEDLSVGGSLSLEGTQVTRLPEGLSVGKHIFINRDQDIEVPKHLRSKIVKRK
jgi:hypothetical protein